MTWTPDIVKTKWGFITPQAFYRLSQAYKQAIDQSQPSFEIDGEPFVTSFAGYLIEFCRNEGLHPIRGDGTEPIFNRVPIVSGRDHAPLINLLKGHLDTLCGVMVESDGQLYLFKDNKLVAMLSWPSILDDIQALVASDKPS